MLSNKLAHFGKTLFQASGNARIIAMSQMAQSGFRNYETIAISKPAPHIVQVEMNRPEKRNAFNETLWNEMGECFKTLEDDSNCRAIILTGSGSMFTSGIDLSDLGNMAAIVGGEDDIARKCKKMYQKVKKYQDSFSSLEKCQKPVIAAIHSACIGAGMDLICGTDIRYCTSDAWFQVKEVEVGLAADVGTLQRLPRIMGNQSLVRELAFSARKMFADEALAQGLVGRVFPNKPMMLEASVEMASQIAKHSPVAVQGTKRHLIYARDHTVEQSLEYEAIWNMTMLQGEDLMNSAMAMMSKAKPDFKDY